MVIQQIVVMWAHVWVWHEKPGEKQPTTPPQPPPATKPHSQADFTPRAVGTWAQRQEAENLAKLTSKISVQTTPVLWEPAS